MKYCSLIMTISIIMMTPGCSWQSANKTSKDSEAHTDSNSFAADDPMIIKASELTALTMKGSWELYIGEGNEGYVTISKGVRPVERKSISITPLQKKEFIKILTSSRFFSLPETLGREVVDSSERQIYVKIGKKERRIIIHYLGPPNPESDAADDEYRMRIKPLWAFVRGLISDKDAADSRPYD